MPNVNSSPIVAQSTDRSAEPIVAAVASGDYIDQLLGLAATIDGLCTTGADIHGQPMSAETREQESAIPAFDVLAKNLLQSVANQVACKSHQSVGILVVSKSGTVIQSAHSGWDASDFRVQGRVLAKVAKESVWRLEPRFSSNALTGLSEAGQVLTVPVESSACLNELGKILGTPLCAIPVSLKESSGFAVFLFDASSCAKQGISDFLAQAAQLWHGKTGHESLVRQLDAWLIVQRCSWVNRLLRSVEAFRSQPRWWLTPIGLLCGALFVPVPYYPRRECVFEPETKQYLSSPIQGRIASCEVRPGDHVEKGQLMARLDDDQLRRDLATANSEYDGAMKKRDSALATRATGNAELAIIEMNQAKWKIDSIQDQLRRLEIRATSEGIVVQGDWQRNVGMPLTLGQSLFEVAELKSMTAEVRLLSSDLAQINVGDEVSVRSDASGISTFRGKISRIEPRASVIDDEAVFIADVVVHDPEMQLRPGMKAKAQIHAGWKSLGWYLFNRPYRWVANQWIW